MSISASGFITTHSDGLRTVQQQRSTRGYSYPEEKPEEFYFIPPSEFVGYELPLKAAFRELMFDKLQREGKL